MPDQYRFFTADVFTDTMFGGNQLAVFPDGRGIADARMQQIARELNLSETVFVFPPETITGTRRLRIFTPGSELPFAGHPTVGTAFVLAVIGEIFLTGDETDIVFEEGVGPVSVKIRSRDGHPAFCQLAAAKLPEEGPPAPSSADLAAVLSLTPDEVRDGDERPRAFSCGVPFLFVTVRDLAALGRIRINADALDRHLGDYTTREIFALTPASGENQIRARMFAPGFGIVEDPATGSAVSALAGYLAPAQPSDSTLRWTVSQGVEMGRPSTLELEADFAGGRIAAVRVGGSSVMVSEGVLKLPA